MIGLTYLPYQSIFYNHSWLFIGCTIIKQKQNENHLYIYLKTEKNIHKKSQQIYHYYKMYKQRLRSTHPDSRPPCSIFKDFVFK